MYFKLRKSLTSDGKNSINETPKQGQEQWEELYLWYIQVKLQAKKTDLQCSLDGEEWRECENDETMGRQQKRGCRTDFYSKVLSSGSLHSYCVPSTCMHAHRCGQVKCCCLPQYGPCRNISKGGSIQLSPRDHASTLIPSPFPGQMKWLGNEVSRCMCGGGTSLCVAVLDRDQVLFHHGHIWVNSVAWDL